MRLPSTLLVLLLAPSVAFAWGFDGHRRLAKHMQDPLPSTSCLRQWIAAHQSTSFQDMAADPDRWRGSDPDEWPRHYLNIDWANPVSSYPREWADVETHFGRYAQANGQVPWRVDEYYGKLVQAFQSKNTSTILQTLAHTSHYVTDAFSVLHDTKNFDPNGLHARWESDMLDVSSYIDGITNLSLQYIGTVGRADPRNNVFDIVIVGNGLVPDLLAADQAATSTDGGSYSLSKLYAQSKDLTARRWGDALTVMASLIATAWIEAGSPMLSGMPSGCSRSLPQEEIVLKGFPVPGGFTHPDGGTEPDAGSDGGLPPQDGGSGGGGGAGGQGGGGGTGAVEEPPPDAGCQGCGGAAAALFLPFVLGMALASRRRRP